MPILNQFDTLKAQQLHYMNIRLENTTFDMTYGINYTHLRYFIQIQIEIQIILLVE